MNRAHIEMKLIFTWLLRNVKLSSCTDDADGQAPNTIMAYIEPNIINTIVYNGTNEPTFRMARSARSASPSRISVIKKISKHTKPAQQPGWKSNEAMPPIDPTVSVTNGTMKSNGSLMHSFTAWTFSLEKLRVVWGRFSTLPTHVRLSGITSVSATIKMMKPITPGICPQSLCSSRKSFTRFAMRWFPRSRKHSMDRLGPSGMMISSAGMNAITSSSSPSPLTVASDSASSAMRSSFSCWLTGASSVSSCSAWYVLREYCSSWDPS
mmetsp:Transcript_12553/g.34141  ORF Transcript_12553/g.34141 Transcript_12553/m.34141 type:complete len:266 (-) Transcript_12553:1026-1823(-)